MKSYLYFIKKELVEQYKNYKLFILGGVLLIFAMLSPVLAKMMPEIFKSVDMGIEIIIPQATFIDSYSQFFKNINQTVIIMIIFLFSGNIVQEINRGTAILMFSKGLSRSVFILSKFTAELIMWTVCYALSVAVFEGYTQYLFPLQAPENVFLTMLCLWLFTTFLLTVIIFAGVLVKQSYLAMIISGGIIMVLFILSVFPKIADYLPTYLVNINIELIAGTKEFNDVLISILITTVLSILCLLAAVTIFKKKQI